MKVGFGSLFQNPDDRIADYDLYRSERQLADLTEPLGFDSYWAGEHHFSNYSMIPNALEMLTWVAARTERIELGSMVVVLPWHDPLWVTEQVAMLDNLSDGRVVLGIGRGAARREYEGFRVEMGESRERFIEYAKLILGGLETGICEFKGVHIEQPRVELRPPAVGTFAGRCYAAAVSPASSRIMAELGVGILIIPQKPLDAIEGDLDTYRGHYREANGREAPPPIYMGNVICDESSERAAELMRQCSAVQGQAVSDHYEFASGHLEGIRGYEHYAELGRQYTSPASNSGSGDEDAALESNVWGTPEQCYEKIVAIRKRLHNDTFIAQLRSGALPYDETERNMRLFAREVLPELQKLEPAH